MQPAMSFSHIMDVYSSVFVVFCINFISRNRAILKHTYVQNFLTFQFIMKYFASGQMTNMLLNFSILELCHSQKRGAVTHNLC